MNECLKMTSEDPLTVKIAFYGNAGIDAKKNIIQRFASNEFRDQFVEDTDPSEGVGVYTTETVAYGMVLNLRIWGS